ncbi:DUF421 domain-containing protein [Priestia endophytica]|uniref:DUF421 domain-containing protein n=1 Tax=Priestia endophytica TaxID=135735 RepID=UPI000DCA4B1B|nr:DUF421 domain-containing protein [Priestia endophytica]RAS75159.1 DUF421 domain-containing protein [Priestia endophytica]
MELLKELMLIFGRIVTIIPLLLVVTLVMGRRAIGELPVFDFLVVLVLGSVVGTDIADPSVEHLHTAVTIVLIALLQRLIAKLAISFRKFGKIITFDPTVVIKDGQISRTNIKKIRYSLDNILQMLRENGVFDITHVHLGIIESNGKLTVYKHPANDVVTINDLGIEKSLDGIAYPVVIEGKVYRKVLTDLHLTDEWLNQELKKKGIKDINRIFLATINERNDMYVSLYDSNPVIKPDVIH